MVGARNVPLGHPAVVRPVGSGSSDTSWLMVLLMIVVAVAGTAGVVYSVMRGHNDWAIAIGIVASAFFTRAAC